jgi:hypothetical protein
LGCLVTSPGPLSAWSRSTARSRATNNGFFDGATRCLGGGGGPESAAWLDRVGLD